MFGCGGEGTILPSDGQRFRGQSHERDASHGAFLEFKFIVALQALVVGNHRLVNIFCRRLFTLLEQSQVLGRKGAERLSVQHLLEELVTLGGEKP